MSRLDNKKTSVPDSKTFIFNLQHSIANQQLQYLCAQTFDCFLIIRKIHRLTKSWSTILNLKMCQPIANTFIQFSYEKQPIGFVVVYFQGTVEYTKWANLQRNYQKEIQAAKRRLDLVEYQYVLMESQRFRYVNKVRNQDHNLEEAFTLENVFFVEKHQHYIYTLNFKGQLKILKVDPQQIDKCIKLHFYYRFQSLLTCAVSLRNYKQVDSNSVIVAISIQSIGVPFILHLNPQINTSFINQSLQMFKQSLQQVVLKEVSPTKFLSYSSSCQTIISCNDQNELNFFSLQAVKSNSNKNSQKIKILAYLETVCEVLVDRRDKKTDKDKEIILDISVINDCLLVLGLQAAVYFDLTERRIVYHQRFVQRNLHFGKLVTVEAYDKHTLLIKKKFDYFDPKTKSSTNLHLYTGSSKK